MIIDSDKDCLTSEEINRIHEGLLDNIVENIELYHGDLTDNNRMSAIIFMLAKLTSTYLFHFAGGTRESLELLLYNYQKLLTGVTHTTFNKSNGINEH